MERTRERRVFQRLSKCNRDGSHTTVKVLTKNIASLNRVEQTIVEAEEKAQESKSIFKMMWETASDSLELQRFTFAVYGE